MSLIALPPDFLRLNRRVPFGIYDAAHNLLVAPGVMIEKQEKLEALRGRPLFADAVEAGPYAQSLQRSAHEMVHKNATLEMIASAQTHTSSAGPGASSSRGLSRSQLAGGSGALASSLKPSTIRRDGPLPERVTHLVSALGLILRDAVPEAQWLDRIESVYTAWRELAEGQVDSLWYLLMQHVTHKPGHYSGAHALMCATLLDRVARSLDWDNASRDSMVRAALTMDASIATMQDSLMEFDSTPRPNQQQPLRTHGDSSATLLGGAGVTDPLWLALVRQHHSASAPVLNLDTASLVDRCVALLCAVEAYVARLHRRGERLPVTPAAALRATGLDAQGQLTTWAVAIVKAIGMYPPGSYVRLQGGELGVVHANGRRMNTPLVAVFLSHSGLALKDPLMRDTAQPGRNVVEAVAPDQVKVQVEHERVLALR